MDYCFLPASTTVQVTHGVPFEVIIAALTVALCVGTMMGYMIGKFKVYKHGE